MIAAWLDAGTYVIKDSQNARLVSADQPGSTAPRSRTCDDSSRR